MNLLSDLTESDAHNKRNAGFLGRKVCFLDITVRLRGHHAS